MPLTHPRPDHGRYPLLQVFILLLFLFPLFTVRGDDIEVYLQPPPEPVAPNILFLLDESGSMDNPVAPGVTRRDALVNALHRIVDGGLLNNINATLLGYTTMLENPTATRLVAHTGDFTIVGNDISHFRSAIDQLQSLNFTPTTDALAAAVDWFNPNRRTDRIQNSSSDSPLTGDPEELKCAPNRIILLSDGAPNTSTRTGYEGIACAEVHLFDDFSDERAGWHNDGARCANEISTWAYQTDLATGTGWDGVQNILTYTLSFGTTPGSPTQRFMDQIAARGGGESWHVVDEDSIVDAFNTVVAEAQDSIDYAMNAPSIPFNPDNAAINGDFIYVPLFLPEARGFWRGNLKKYRVDVGDDDIRLLANGGQRVLNDDHTFASTVDLFCSQGGCLPDGGDPLSGGVAGNMTGLRTLYTNLNPGLSLAHPSNRIHRETTGITVETLGVANEEDRTTLLNWITRDPAYIATAQQPAHDGVMGAPIHTQPVVVRYGQESTVYLPTSEGVLEAIDTNTGRELWAFMPRDLMTDIRHNRNNDSSVTPYYGLDGPLSVYETGGRKIAIVGMRRGGRKYHMLDITDRLEPDYLAEISREASPTDY
ncbi:MAG: hypothetical protein ABW094_11320, partial [Candidatus Thiodiazotropha sp.]